MKFIMLGQLSPAWLVKQKDRTDAARKKLGELGITIESLHYTQGRYDFVDIVEAPDSSAMLTFSLWYAGQGFGRIETMPAFSEKDLDAAAAKA